MWVLLGQNQQIAERLYVSPHALKARLKKIYRKLGVQNRVQAVVWMVRNEGKAGQPSSRLSGAERASPGWIARVEGASDSHWEDRVVNHEQYIGQVQHRARLGTRGEAERATRATLETLAERIGGGTAGNLAAQLPSEIGLHLRREPSDGGSPEAEQFSVEDFFERVTAREGVDAPEAVFHARVVLEVTDDATTGQLMAKVQEQLPAEFHPVFQAGSSGPMNRPD